MLSARPAALPLDVDRAISTKTPGRALAKTRNVLQENATRVIPVTAIGKGRKVVQSTPLQSKTLQIDRVLKDLPGKQVGPSKLKDTPAIRPLGDKTPFPNRTANQPLATGAKIAKPGLLDSSLHPSSARKHDRLPRSAGKAFETPITNGKHWDVSDMEIDVDAPIANESIEEESLDEIEYMPPKVEDFSYEPPFEMPNYREVGKSLMALIRSYSIEDDPPSNDLTFTVDASEKTFFEPPVLPLREIEDDCPFARPPKPAPAVKPQTSVTSKLKSATASKSAHRPTIQRTMSATRTAAIGVRPSTTSNVRPTTTSRKSISQPVSRAPTVQSTTRAPVSRATVRSTPPVRAGPPQLSRVTTASRPLTKSAARPTAPGKGNAVVTQPGAMPVSRNLPMSNTNVDTTARSNATRPRSGTITKAAFESNTHVVVHIRNNSLEDVKKDLEGLIVLDDAFDDEDEFRFEV